MRCDEACAEIDTLVTSQTSSGGTQRRGTNPMHEVVTWRRFGALRSDR
jgi:hypothetical protein